MYDNTNFNIINSSYICEPYYNHQFIITNNGFNIHVAVLETTDRSITKDNDNTNISCYLNSGYLSVDTMNDKRFKDLIFEFDSLTNKELTLKCNFYIDGTPMLITDTEAVVVDQYGVDTISIAPDLNVLDSTVIKPISEFDTSPDHKQFYGSIYKIINNSDENAVYSSNRAHLRIPIFGKGRLPSFSIELSSEKPYEFINYSMIYKEKNINRRR
jgi:hypothetical protein